MAPVSRYEGARTLSGRAPSAVFGGLEVSGSKLKRSSFGPSSFAEDLPTTHPTSKVLLPLFASARFLVSEAFLLLEALGSLCPLRHSQQASS